MSMPKPWKPMLFTPAFLKCDLSRLNADLELG